MSGDPMAIGAWLEGLGTLVRGSKPAEDAARQVAAMAPHLREQFAASAFTRESLEAVAGKCRTFPTYGAVRQALADHWRTARPATPTTAGAESGAAGHWERFIARRLAEGGDRAHLRSLLRSNVDGPELGRILGRLFPETAPERGSSDRAGEYDPAWVADRVRKLIGDPADHWRTIHARTLLGMLERYRPDLAAEHRETLEGLQSAKPRGSGAGRAPAPTPPPAGKPKPPPAKPEATPEPEIRGLPPRVLLVGIENLLLEHKRAGTTPPPPLVARAEWLRRQVRNDNPAEAQPPLEEATR